MTVSSPNKEIVVRSVRLVRSVTGVPWMAGALVAAVLLGGVPSPSAGQQVEYQAYGGWRFGGTFRLQEGDLELADGNNFGAQVDVRVRPDATVVLLVDYQPTTLRLRPRTGTVQDLFDVHVWYFQFGGAFEVHNQTPILPYLMATIGMSWFDPSGAGDDRDSDFGFAGILGLGAKVRLGRSPAYLRFQGRALMNIMQLAGTSVWCGSGGACYTRVGGNTEPVQTDLSIGLSIVR